MCFGEAGLYLLYESNGTYRVKISQDGFLSPNGNVYTIDLKPFRLTLDEKASNDDRTISMYSPSISIEFLIRHGLITWK